MIDIRDYPEIHDIIYRTLKNKLSEDAKDTLDCPVELGKTEFTNLVKSENDPENLILLSKHYKFDLDKLLTISIRLAELDDPRTHILQGQIYIQIDPDLYEKEILMCFMNACATNLDGYYHMGLYYLRKQIYGSASANFMLAGHNLLYALCALLDGSNPIDYLEILDKYEDTSDIIRDIRSIIKTKSEGGYIIPIKPSNNLWENNQSYCTNLVKRDCTILAIKIIIGCLFISFVYMGCQLLF